MSTVQTPVRAVYVSLGLTAAVAVLASLSSSMHWFSTLRVAYPLLTCLWVAVVVHHVATLAFRYAAGDCVSPRASHQFDCDRAPFSLPKRHAIFLRVVLILFALATLLTFFGTAHIWMFRSCPLTRIDCVRWVWVRVLLVLLDAAALAETAMLFLILRSMSADVGPLGVLGLRGEDDALLG
ncbi:hypothetical protein PUNSTDRAFT_115188 [Punctularia strigosozonata HHB-11173 SS5]|uniref:uncharacterized protein n=1 Tax=Punctularia strigosozonata (strain HHB-11173) TaxID=741275 RepID=UPI000441708F|nr:uncharacterized protein PUNSTDRAFT_115188 [Punctularia strigosozonata HHB-11173 SS5]EIN06663.1 hypothetical protein PUNSTDRAFT_115188 [Punctularia strigosozonata HHB-11173 SS5]